MKESEIIRIKKIAENNQGQIRAIVDAVTKLNQLVSGLYHILQHIPGYAEALEKVKKQEDEPLI
jgi:hypothetical protein